MKQEIDKMIKRKMLVMKKITITIYFYLNFEIPSKRSGALSTLLSIAQFHSQNLYQITINTG